MADTIDLVVTKDSLKTIEIAEIGEVNVLIGPNNSGKTTVLRALQSSAYVVQMTVAGVMARYADKLIMMPKRRGGELHFRPVESLRTVVGQQSGDFAFFQRKGLDQETISNQTSNLRQMSSRLSQKIFCLWHRRKSEYRAPLERVDELDPEATKLVARLAQIRHGSDQGANINKFVADVIPGCPGFTVRPVDEKDSQIFVGEYPLQSVGGGIEQTLAIALALITEDPTCILLIEEPETNLHPSSQRTLVRKIMNSRQGRTIFITTHSPVILNEIARYDGVNVYRIWPSMAEGTRIEPSRTTSALREALDGLGARPSDILQANCVLWVEGPTEAILLRHLIELFHPKLYVEHTDMEFMFTGGSSIKHMGSEDERLIDVLRICRNAFVLFDRDDCVDQDMKRKERPDLSELPHVTQHVTWGYEFEWYYPESIIAEAYSVDEKQLFGSGKGDEAFDKAVANAGGPQSPKKVKRAQDIVAKMDTLDREEARRLWSEGSAGADLKQLLDKIVNRIEFGRAENGLPSATPPNP